MNTWSLDIPIAKLLCSKVLLSTFLPVCRQLKSCADDDFVPFEGIRKSLVQPATQALGLFCNASAKYTQELRPSRPQGVSPGFRASLVQPSASLRPFHSRFASFQGWEIPLPLRLLPPPPSPGGVRHVCTRRRPI
jgi:hypothetical protein